MKRIKILYVCGGPFDYGGISSFIINYYRHINHDIYAIDFAVYGLEKGVYDSEVIACGSQVFNIPPKRSNYSDSVKTLKKVIVSGRYDIVHSHLDSGNYHSLKIAKKCNVPIRISHCHSASFLCTNLLSLFVNKWYKKNLFKVATHNLACSNDAGIFLYGKRPFTVFKNAIDVPKYSFYNGIRCSYRKQLSISDSDIVIGCIGHINSNKNQSFLINVIRNLLLASDKYKLILVGTAENLDIFEKYLLDRGVKENVIILGIRNDVHLLYNAFDIFAVPSLSEGLSITAIEAQANGLITLLSTGVPKEAKILETTKIVPLDEMKWVNTILSLDINRNNNINSLFEKGYDINSEAAKLMDFYDKLYC